MYPRIRLVLLAALVAAVLPSAALAQSSGFELIPHVGYRTAGNFDFDDFAGLDSDLEIDEGEAYGVAFDIPLTRGGGLKLELSLSRQESALTVDEGLFLEGARLGDLDVTYAQVGLLPARSSPTSSSPAASPSWSRSSARSTTRTGRPSRWAAASRSSSPTPSACGWKGAAMPWRSTTASTTTTSAATIDGVTTVGPTTPSSRARPR